MLIHKQVNLSDTISKEKDISVGFKTLNCYLSVVYGEYFQKPNKAKMLWSQESCVGARRVGVSWGCRLEVAILS